MGTMFNLLQEVAERLRRVETRLVVVGDKVGADLRTEVRVEVKLAVGANQSLWCAEIDAMDVSLSRIATALHEAGHDQGEYDILYRGYWVASIDLDALNLTK